MVTITRRTADKLDTVFDVARVVSKLDPKDPHFELKVSNIVKGYTHNVQASENNAAKHRTYRCKTVEDFQEFFAERAEKHYSAAKDWFVDRDSWKLKHHYDKPLTGDNLNEKSIVERKKRYPKCDTPAGECRCWEIKIDESIGKSN